MGKTLPSQVTHLPTAFGTCTLKSAKQLSSVMMKDTRRTTMKYLVNAGTSHSNMLLFLLDQKQSHHVNQAIFSPVPSYSHCSSRRKMLYIQTAGKSSCCYIYVATWLFSNIYGSKLPPLHYTIRGRKSTIIPFKYLVIESNHDYNTLWALEVTINYWMLASQWIGISSVTERLLHIFSNTSKMLWNWSIL